MHRAMFDEEKRKYPNPASKGAGSHIHEMLFLLRGGTRRDGDNMVLTIR